MAPQFRIERYLHLHSTIHACQWLTMRGQFGLSVNTLDAYARAIDSYLSFMDARQRTAEESTQADIGGWINQMRERELANATLIQRVTALRLFFEYLVEEGVRSGNPVSRGGDFRCYGEAAFRAPGPVRRLRRLPWIPSDDEWQQVLRVTAGDCLRDQTMLALAYDGALRREELCNVGVSDFDFARRLLTVRAETTKNGSGKVIPYSSATSVLLCQYLNRRRTMREAPDAVFLSESRRNRTFPITAYTWTKVVESIARRTDLPKLTTHTMRHLRLTDLARAGLDMHQIATLAGHRVLQSTLIYIHLSARDLTLAVERAMASIAPRYSSVRGEE
jgi:integrase/recombinase XerD